MSKISIIIQREYTTRVMKKSFIVMTFLTPIFFIAMFVLPGWLATLSDDSDKHIVVIDRTGQYHEALKNNDIYTFEFVDKPIGEVRNDRERTTDFTALLMITDNLATNPKAATLYYEKQVGVELTSYIAGLLNKYTEEQKLAAYNIPNLKEMVKESESRIEMASIKWSADGEEKAASAEFALAIGMVAAMMIYMFIFLYGTQVMNGVMQEKTNRIVEVIVSSARPFDLMMGKIIGVALVGLTQFMIWMVLTVIGVSIVGGGMGDGMANVDQFSAMQGMGNIDESRISSMLSMLMSFNWVQIISLFVVFFLGGYLLYASLFAAIGSAVDNETDANQFTLPVTLPIILAIFAAIYAVRNPEASASFWFSIIPFTSPVVMMVRLPFDVPTWEIALSIAVLVLSFIGTTWIAGKIYRTGILMYGKKVTWKELWKWIGY